MDRRDRLIEAGLALARELSSEAVLQRIVELGVEVTGARYGALGVLEPGKRHLGRFITVGLTPEEEAAIGDPPKGHGLLGALIEDARPMRVDRMGDDPRSVGFPPNHPPMTSMLGAPIVARGAVVGNLYLTDKRGAAAFDAEDEAAVVVLAAQAAVAIENARLYEEARTRARRLEAVREIALGILGGADVEETLRTITLRAASLVDAERAKVVLGETPPTDGEGPALVVPLGSGEGATGGSAQFPPPHQTPSPPPNKETPTPPPP
ncbi:MAG: GAF domain-containing protein, partial [Actinomycetota bacterium]